MASSQGIDYGMGQANVDKTNGIRFGIISQNSEISEDFLSESFEADYGEPTCPNCGNKAQDNNEDCEACAEMDNDMLRADYHCHGANCGTTKFDGQEFAFYCFNSDMAYSDEPNGFYLKDSEYFAHYDNSGFGVWVERAPFYTYAQFCSPCAPGAGDLDSPFDAGKHMPGSKPHFAYSNNKTYCFGHDCFENGRAPYRVFRVADNTEVFPPKE